MRRTITIGLWSVAGVAAASLGALLAFSENDAASDTAAYAAPWPGSLTVSDAQDHFWRLTPALLHSVYEAFGKTGEAEIYDTLAAVTHGDALEYLYLERVGAMAGGGLDAADQTIHEIALLETHVRRKDAVLHIDASWQVIGTVGHAEHLHVRGNTYRANLVVAPADGAWKITGFDLLEVNRDAAGETFVDPDAPAETN